MIPAVEAIPAFPVTRREPREVAVEARFVVRHVRADSFDAAKEQARDFVPKATVKKYGLTPFAAREADGSYTVEFR